MSRLIDIDDLQGCAIIRPTTHEEMEHIKACKNLISHDDIPTAYDVDKVVEQLEEMKKAQADMYMSTAECCKIMGRKNCHGIVCEDCFPEKVIEIVKAGGKSEDR